MFETIKNCFKVKEIRKKIFITLLLLLIFRLGCYIPVPGIDVDTFKSYINDGSFSFLEILTSITGGSLANATLFALGISPYINASIIVQLLTIAIPKLEEWSKQGDDGRRKIANVTRVMTLVPPTRDNRPSQRRKARAAAGMGAGRAKRAPRRPNAPGTGQKPVTTYRPS